MKTRIQLLCFLVFLTAVSISYGDTTWVQITDSTPAPVEVSITSNTSSSVVFTIDIPGFYTTDIEEDDTTYQKIWFDNESFIIEPGHPALPVISKNIAVPICSGISVSITYSGQDTLGDYYIFPALGYSENCQGELSKDYSIYNSGNCYPSANYNCSDIDYFRDQAGVVLTIYPFKFSPANSKLRICSSMTVTLTFSNPSGDINTNLGLFSSVAQEMFINYNSTDEFTSTDAIWEWADPDDIPSWGRCDYLIITAGFIYEDEDSRLKIQDLAQHRVDLNGFEVRLVNVLEIPGIGQQININDWTDIRTFIADVYDEYRLYFVLLAGDAWDDAGAGGGQVTTVLIPAPQEVDHHSDHYYADFITQGVTEWEDVAFGRLSVGNYDELEIGVDKILDYEAGPQCAGDWKYNIMQQRFVGGG